jgi:hypothetical protein
MAALVEEIVPVPDDHRSQRQFAFIARGCETDDPYNGECNLSFDISEENAGSPNSRDVQAIRAIARKAGNGRSTVLIMQGRLANQTLGRLPYPAYDLFFHPDAAYQFDEPALGLDGPMLNLNTSRGCSYGCSFCSVEGVWGKAYRWFPSPWIIGLVSKLKRDYGLRSVFFREDEFIMGPRAQSAWKDGAEARDDVLTLAHGLHALGIRWAIENRADAFGSTERAEGFFRKLATLGLAGVFVGIESASDLVRNKILNKHLSERAIRNFFEWAHKAGVCTVANVMFGVRRLLNGQLITDGPDDWAATEALLAELEPDRVDRYVYVGVPVSQLYNDHIERGDYELIDVNGYLYPKGFTERAHDIYGHGIEMALIEGQPNLRVGPGLLPGIPSADQETNAGTVVTRLRQLSGLPGVLQVNLTSVRVDPGVLPSGCGVLNELHKLVSCDALPRATISELLKIYRPGEPYTIRRLKNGPTLAIATIRSPSAEAMLITLQLAHRASSYETILQALSRTAALLNSYVRSEFVKRYAPFTEVTRDSAQSRSHLQVVSRRS